jgi:NHL repeat
MSGPDRRCPSSAGSQAPDRPRMQQATFMNLHATDQGDKVRYTGHNANPTSTSKTGFLATLAGLLRVRGSGAPAVRVGGLVLAALLSALVCLGVSVAPAQALEGYEPATPASFGEPGPGPGQLEAPEGVAVNDTTGDVYVADVGNARIDEFEADGKFLRAWGWGVRTGAAALETCTTTCRKGLIGTEPGEFTTGAFIAVNNSGVLSNGDVYVGDPGDNTVTKFTKDGALVEPWGTKGQLKETTGGTLFSTLRGVAVDSTGNLWVYDENVTEEQDNVDEFSETAAFEPAGSFNTGRGTEPGLAVESSENVYLVPGAEGVSRFASGKEKFEFTERVRAVALGPEGDILADQGQDLQLFVPSATPGSPPTLRQTFAGGGLSESHGIAAGAAAAYATQRAANNVLVFSFGPLRPQVQAESVSEVGSSSATFHGQVVPQGEATSYFFEYGLTAGYGSRTPVDSAGAGTGVVSVLAGVEGLLPDTTYHFRLVASNANGERQGGDVVFSTFPQGILGLPDGRGFELVSSLNNGDASVVVNGGRAAADGSAVSYNGQAPPAGGNGNSSNPHSGGIQGGAGDNKYFASRSGGGGWSASDIQPAGLDSVQYLAFSSGLAVGILSSTEALTEGAPNSQALYSRDDGSGSYRLLAAGMAYAGATPDGSHVLVSSGSGGLFETGAGALSPVNVLPEGGSAAHAVFGAPGPDLSNAISSDGSRVFWTQTDAEGHPQRLFVTEHAGSAAQRPVQLDASHAPPHPGGEGRFAAASGDGSRVFFTACSVLTPNSTAAPTPTPGCEVEEERGKGPFRTPAGNDLYEANTATGVLSDLSVDQAQNANVVGVLGVSADGSSVYFAAGGALASGAQQQQCVRGVVAEFGPGGTPTKCNIYLVHDGGASQFVAAVTNEEWADWSSVVGTHTAYVAPVGGELVFESGLNLTGFDSRGAHEIYMYTPGAGVSCLSCNPSGALTAPASGAVLPVSQSTTFALRDVSADGSRVFFETAESLVPADQNGKQDVYEWEREGSGSCVRVAGCLFVLSGGTSTENSTLLDASESGDDVFIVTRADLVARDRGEAFQVYDVRVGAVQPPAESACSGTGCQGVPAAPPIFATPSSVTFNGVGNFPPPAPVKKIKKKTVKCAKGKKLSHGKCVKQKKPKKSTHRKGSK